MRGHDAVIAQRAVADPVAIGALAPAPDEVLEAVGMEGVDEGRTARQLERFVGGDDDSVDGPVGDELVNDRLLLGHRLAAGPAPPRPKAPPPGSPPAPP